ncbi:MAG: putative photosynthetic complex assembly protein PuhE [Pseudomonadota bacterium]
MQAFLPDFASSWPAAAAVVFALLCWWFGTGIILWLVRLPAATFKWSLALCSGLLALSLWSSTLSMQGTSSAHAYLAFASVIVMWSWHELAFLTGWLTGPRKVPLSPGARGLRRFTESAGAVMHHEIALLVNFMVLLMLQQGQPNHVALCTFSLLWCMRFTAKMNLFFGVPQVGEQYLPAHLVYLGSFFRRGPVTAFFYVTMGLACGTWAWLIWQVRAGEVALTTGWVLLAALLGLAIAEHLLMAFPVPLQRLWGWAMSRQSPAASTQTQAALPAMPVLPGLPAHPGTHNPDSA